MKLQGSKCSYSSSNSEIKGEDIRKSKHSATQKIMSFFFTIIIFFQVVTTKQTKAKPQKCFPGKRNSSNQWYIVRNCTSCSSLDFWELKTHAPTTTYSYSKSPYINSDMYKNKVNIDNMTLWQRCLVQGWERD